MFLQSKIAELEFYLKKGNINNPSISAQSTFWHIEHSLQVIKVIIEALQQTKTEHYKWHFSLKRLIIFTTGVIPRGKAKAPHSVVPQNQLNYEIINTSLEQVKLLLPLLNAMPKNNFFNHPFFGLLNVKQSKRMIEIHTLHHLKIIKDICR
jgi:hypothetical protein